MKLNYPQRGCPCCYSIFSARCVTGEHGWIFHLQNKGALADRLLHTVSTMAAMCWFLSLWRGFGCFPEWRSPAFVARRHLQHRGHHANRGQHRGRNILQRVHWGPWPSRPLPFLNKAHGVAWSGTGKGLLPRVGNSSSFNSSGRVDTFRSTPAEQLKEGGPGWHHDVRKQN